MNPRLRAALLLGLVVAGCQPDAGLGDPCAVRGDCRAGTHCGSGGLCIAGCAPVVPRTLDVAPTRSLTLLLVIDDSGSMSEEQASFAEQMPRLLDTLFTGFDASTGLRFTPVRQLRVGVVTTDMGTGPRGVCDSPFGDDGVLQTLGDRADPDCSGTYPTWLSFGDLEPIRPESIDCVLGALGTSGCGFEQQLEATLKALTPSTSGITFAEGTVGHGDGQNAGFVDPDAVLAISILTDEDDCSTTDNGLFDLESSTYGPNLNLRCSEHADVLHPLERYLDGLLELDTEGLVYAPITGVPVDLAPDPGLPLAPQIDALLEDERMIERPDPEDATRLVPSCDTAGRGVAYPPRRIAELTARFEERGAYVALGSICQESYAGPMGSILGAIADALGPVCLNAPTERDADGLIGCELIEILDPESGVTCADLPGRRDRGIDEATGRRSCTVDQLAAPGVVPSGAGWYYDDFGARTLARCPETPQRITFTVGAEPAIGSRTRVDCTETRPPTWGASCESRPGRCTEGEVPRYLPGGLTCDRAVCKPRCASSADCRGGYRCEVGFCRDPICDRP